MYIYTCIYIHVYIHASYIYICMDVHVYMYRHMSVRLYIYVYMYIHQLCVLFCKLHIIIEPLRLFRSTVQGGKEPQNTLSLQVIFRKRAL